MKSFFKAVRLFYRLKTDLLRYLNLQMFISIKMNEIIKSYQLKNRWNFLLLWNADCVWAQSGCIRWRRTGTWIRMRSEIVENRLQTRQYFQTLSNIGPPIVKVRFLVLKRNIDYLIVVKAKLCTVPIFTVRTLKRLTVPSLGQVTLSS